MIRATRIMFMLLFAAAVASAQPTITALSNTTAARSSRLLIQGSGFGTARGSGHVDIGGIVAPLTRWSDTLAYVPEKAAIGSANVQVFDSAGLTSNTVSLKVTPRPGPSRPQRAQKSCQLSPRSRPNLSLSPTTSKALTQPPKTC